MKLAITSHDELADLAPALNGMAEQFNERIVTITLQRNEREAILSSMTEGVLAINAEERILSINQPALKMVEIGSDDCSGKMFLEVVRSSEIHGFIKRTLSGASLQEDELTIVSDQRKDRIFLVHGSPLSVDTGHLARALIVLSDVTSLRRLETMHSEFVANVSHELRTPLTSIKGFVETLRAGAIDNKEDSQRFLAIIESQVNRLSGILKDLLSLSAIEQDQQRQAVPPASVALAPVVFADVGMCRPRAQEKGISIEVACDGALHAAMKERLWNRRLSIWSTMR